MGRAIEAFNRFFQPWCQVRAGPDNQSSLIKGRRLRGTQRVGMGRTTRFDQGCGCAQIPHNLRHKRCNRGNIGNDRGHLGAGGWGKTKRGKRNGERGGEASVII